MTDLVKYLRAHVAPDRPCKRTEQDIACGQAADEIERLRAELDEIHSCSVYCKRPLCVAMRENERLRGLLQKTQEFITLSNDAGCSPGECSECDMHRLALSISAALATA